MSSEIVPEDNSPTVVRNHTAHPVAESQLKSLKVGATYEADVLRQLEQGVEVKRPIAKVVVVIPAHNEAETIAMTIGCALDQTYPPERVLVMADNCTDDTVKVARAAGAEVVETVDNTAKKGGAINQGLALVMPTLADHDYILTMDADGGVKPDIVEVALEVFESRPGLGGLSGSVRCRDQATWIETCQAIEYERGRRIMARKHGKIHVLSGAAAFFKVSVLREIAEARGTKLPGVKGLYMLEDSLVEDFELTLAVLELGYSITSTKRAQMVTDLMRTVKMLEAQRMRWYRGTLETLWLYGWKPYNIFTFASITFNMFASTLLPLALMALVFGYLAVGGTPSWMFAILAPLFIIENYICARRVGTRRAKIMALSFFPLFLYDQIQFTIYWRALKHAVGRKAALWDGDQDHFA